MTSQPPAQDPDPAATRGSRPAPASRDAADHAVQPDDSNIGEEDPGAALDDPAVRDAMQHEVEPADRSRSDQRSSR